jgi:hypothetical protein
VIGLINSEFVFLNPYPLLRDPWLTRGDKAMEKTHIFTPVWFQR